MSHELEFLNDYLSHDFLSGSGTAPSKTTTFDGCPSAVLGQLYDAYSDNDHCQPSSPNCRFILQQHKRPPCLDLVVEHLYLTSHQPCSPNHSTDLSCRELLRPSRPQHHRHTHTHRIPRVVRSSTGFARSSVVPGCRA